MNKYINVPNPDQTFNNLIKMFGLPEINNRLNIYGYIGEDEIQIEINNQRIGFKISTEFNDFVFVENKRVKYFFKYLKSLGLGKISLGRANIFRFQSNNVILEYYEDTLIGDFIIVRLKPEDDKFVSHILMNCGLFYKDREFFDKKIANLDLKYEELFSEFGVLNSNIKKYCIENNIDIRSNSETLKTRIENINNDFSFYEDPFKKITKINLLGIDSVKDSSYFEPISIVIPCFGAENTIIHVLDSIQSQNLAIEQLQSIQVILVDDGSNIKLLDVISSQLYSYSYKIDLVRLENNSGLANARNAGISLIKHKYTLFIDADIILPKNYILDMFTRSKLIPNALFVSFRTRISEDNDILKVIKDGLESNLNPDDSRIFNKSRTDQIEWNSFELDKQVKTEFLDDSNYFKQLSYGGKIGIYTLPSVVSGHNMFTRTSIIRNIGGFSTKFKGWGLEDTYFGTLIISKGNFIIPVLSSTVYHIGFGPRDNNIDKKIRELESNYSTYLQLLESEW